MDTSSLAPVQTGQVNDNVANAAEEVVLVGVPVAAIVLIRVRVDNGNAFERRRSLDDGHVERISHDLGVVVLDDRFGHDIGAWREVDERRSGRRRVTSLSTAASGGDGRVDGRRIIRGAVACPRQLNMLKS